MENSHLVAILKTFSKKEFRELRKWLQSPAHNQREDVNQLFEYFTSRSRLENDKLLKKEKVFSKVFPREEYDDAKIRQTMHFFLKAVEEFLIYNEQKADEVRSRITLANVYRKRNMPKAFQRTARQINDLQQAYPYRNGDYLWNEYLLQSEKYSFLIMQQRTTSANLQEVSDVLDLSFLSNKLRQAWLMLSHQTVNKTQYDIGLLQEALRHVEEKGFVKEPVIAAYYYMYMAITSEDDPSFFEKLRKVIEESSQLFPNNEIRDINLGAINYCIKRANTGGETYIREAFELFRSGFENRTLMQNGQISRYSFRNAVTAGLKLKEYEWVDSFIHNYKQYLDKKYRESFFLHSLARLNFERKNYDQAMRLLVQTDFDDMLINLNAKTMLFKMYYELEEINALESLLESMRAYVQRKEVMGYHKNNFQNIVRYTKKLVRVTPYNEKQKDKLRQEILEANPLTEREWLLEQLETVP